MPNTSPITTSLVVLIIIQLVMLCAMFFQAPPFPPYVLAPFAMGPFLGASLACCAAAIMQGPTRTQSGRVLAGVAALMAMVSYGPQKWFDPATPQIWPAVLAAQIAVIVIAHGIYRAFASRSATA
ncbi:MAG: hypothetical protein AAFR13_08860 [Pseudomonadota bacterium]